MVKLQRNFLWGINEGIEVSIGWHGKVCESKKEGRLGIKDLEKFNLALFSKWKWRALMEEEASWRGLLLHLHMYGNFSPAFIHRSVLAFHRGAKGSLWWRDVLGSDFCSLPVGWFGACIRRGVGDGGSIDFWNDHWLGHAPLKLVFSNLYAGITNQNSNLADLGVWSNNVWSWVLPWQSSDDDVVTAEAVSLQQILLDVVEPGQ